MKTILLLGISFIAIDNYSSGGNNPLNLAASLSRYDNFSKNFGFNNPKTEVWENSVAYYLLGYYDAQTNQTDEKDQSAMSCIGRILFGDDWKDHLLDARKAYNQSITQSFLEKCYRLGVIEIEKIAHEGRKEGLIAFMRKNNFKDKLSK